MVLVDSLSQNIELIPTYTTSAEETANAIFDNYICRYGRMKTLVSDNAANFVSKLSKAFYDKCGIKHLTIAPRCAFENRAELIMTITQ